MSQLTKLALAASLIATPVAAGEKCSTTRVVQPIVHEEPSVSPLPMLLGGIVKEFNRETRTACYHFVGDPDIGVKIAPEKACFDLSGSLDQIVVPVATLATGVEITLPPIKYGQCGIRVQQGV